MKQIEFAHNYNKLKENEFTTIRGKTNFKKYKAGETVEILLKGKKIFNAEIDHVKKTELADVPFNLLKKDGEFPGFTINERIDFIGLINSLRRFNKLKNENEMVTVLFLKRIIMEEAGKNAE